MKRYSEERKEAVLQIRLAQLHSEGGLFVMRELDRTLGLSGFASSTLSDTRQSRTPFTDLTGRSGNQSTEDLM